MHCEENPIYVFLFWELRGLSLNFHIHVSVSDLYIPRIRPHISLQQNRHLSQIYECRNWEIEHYNSVLEITVSFTRIHKWEPDIYIGFSMALHLRCGRQRPRQMPVRERAKSYHQLILWMFQIIEAEGEGF
jgi:hypothetical protein